MPNNKNICDCYYCEGKYCYRIDARDCEGHIDILITECEEHPDCEHKQLESKKQECKNLNLKIIELNAMNNTLREECKNCKEIEELKEKIKAYDEVYSNHDLLNERNKYKQILADVKEILRINKEELNECLYNDIDEQILQKISEAEDV